MTTATEYFYKELYAVIMEWATPYYPKDHILFVTDDEGKADMYAHRYNTIKLKALQLYYATGDDKFFKRAEQPFCKSIKVKFIK